MRFLICFLFALSASTVTIAQQKQLALIPYPVEVTQGTGYFTIKNTVSVSSSLPGHEWKYLFSYFKDEMKKQFGIAVKEVTKGQPADISFNMRRMPTSGKPAYQLEVTKNGVIINSNFAAPAFHAIQTLFQLFPVDKKVPGQLPVVKIFDHARFEYRGMHLDVSRHFFPVDFIKKYIDFLAYHKLNTFHWHLTDDQGWRIEIKKYPGLTEIGGWRNGTIIGRYPGTGNDNISYGGYYTREEIKEVVQYAKERFIEVIPEIEMPGHSSAAIAAYPWLSCFPEKPTLIPANMISQKSIEEQKKGRVKLVQETWGVFDDVFCAGKDSTFIFLQNVVDEVIELFPSKYFHIGGDECPKAHWKKCVHCQKRMKENNLKDEHELQSYFVQRMEKHLNSRGKILIGWDEILEGGLAPKAVVMSWRGEAGGIEAAKQKHNVIMTPGNPVYFDHTQSENEDSVTIGGYNPIEKVYAYEPIPKELNEEEGKYVLGAQANLWTEYIDNIKKVEYMIFPRMAALSEILWSPKEKKNWDSFEKRLLTQFNRYEKWDAKYSKAYFDLKTYVLPATNHSGIIWKVESKLKNDSIFFKEAKGLPKPIKYTEPVLISETSNKHVFQIFNGNKTSSITQQFHINKATGKKITLTTPPSKTYPGDGAFTLVNGVQNEKGTAKSKEFLGFSGTDCEAIIDFGKEESINSIKIHVLDQQSSWIYPPAWMKVYYSADGINFTEALNAEAGKEVPGEIIKDIEWSFYPVSKTRYLKVFLKNFGTIPEGKPGAGNKAWLFVDEIEVN
ncbi:MAG: family 20 glycosylhydrolase [Chitinophagaceae bacterium]|nr:family 20 glycosylhydrolase [Chitinophagaceae bacterium]